MEERRHRRRPPARPLVLIVDGHDDTRELYAVALGSFGIEAVAIEDGTHAFERAWQAHPDVIVTEVSLPQLDGWSLVEDLKRDPRTRDIPIVVLTGLAESSVRERAERDGCAAVLGKPCLPETLAHTLREVLGGSPVYERASLRHSGDGNGGVSENGSEGHQERKGATGGRDGDTSEGA